MKKIIPTIIFIFFISYGFSQTTEAEKILKIQKTDSIEGWKKGGKIILNLSQTSLTNWAAGGQNSLSTSSLLNLFANHKKGNSLWENSLDIGYGTIKQGENKKWWKTDDQIDFTSKYGKKAFTHCYYAGLINFKTQMTAGFKYPDDSTIISDLLSPAYLLGAIGVNYKPNKIFNAFISPLTSKTTFVNNQSLADAGSFGVEAASYDTSGNKLTSGKNLRNEIGGYVRFFFEKDIMKNVKLKSKTDLFSNYINNPQNIDINWELLISMKVNKYISASISTNLIYDDDIDITLETDSAGKPTKVGPRTQFKELLAIGFSYKF